MKLRTKALTMVGATVVAPAAMVVGLAAPASANTGPPNNIVVCEQEFAANALAAIREYQASEKTTHDAFHLRLSLQSAQALYVACLEAPKPG